MSVGIGFRKDFADEFLNSNIITPDFIEVAPENWIGIGGRWKKTFQNVLTQYPLYAHGLSLSIGSPDPLDFNFLKDIKLFLDTYNPVLYSDHLCYSQCDNAHLYDLLPIPFTEEAIQHVAERIRIVQDVLERKIAIELISYYTPIAPQMREVDFINRIIQEGQCSLLLDVNNIYVNAFNHQYDAKKFLDELRLDDIAYIHIAGHERVADDLIIDTHGQAIIDPVYDLLAYALEKMTYDVPVLLERDFNIPALQDLQNELNEIKNIKQKIALRKQQKQILTA